MKLCRMRLLVGMSALLVASRAFAEPKAPPGFVEPIVHWGVQKGETCEDIAKSMYGSVVHVGLLSRYNRVACAPKLPLPEGTTLILPKTVTSVPDARVTSSHPNVRGRPPGGGWNTVTSGTALYRNHNVQTMEDGRAHVEFLDHTHVYLAKNTLIVVYGTASNTRVTTTPPAIELKTGEVQAGLSGLRGTPAVVTVPEGGLVTAESRETVVTRQASRTTVAVFEGKCNVRSGGQTVTVPKDYGTRFEGFAAPEKPRPLPPAPQWKQGGSDGLIFSSKGGTFMTASWTAVPKAKAYRFEVSRDEGFRDLVVREEIPADVLAFRAEKMPVGAYHLRVRAIDTDDYLGIASTVRRVELVTVEIRGEGMTRNGNKITVNPYGSLLLKTEGELEVALDDGPFGTLSAEVDLLPRWPKVLRLRTKTGTIETVHIDYAKVTADLETTFDAEKRILSVKATLNGTADVDPTKRLKARMQVQSNDRMESAPLSWTAEKNLVGTSSVSNAKGPIHVAVLDDRGNVLGHVSIEFPEMAESVVEKAPPPPRGTSKRIGVRMPPVRPSGAVGIPWWSPTAPRTTGIGIGGGATANGPVLQGHVRASGMLGPVGLDALVLSPPLESAYPNTADYPPTENLAWLGARYLAYRRGASALEIAPAVRLGVPLLWQDQPLQLDVGAAIGGAGDRTTWLVNAGARFSFGNETTGIPLAMPYVVAGGTFDFTNWVRAYGAIDVRVLSPVGDRGAVVPYGFSAGIEAGRQIYFSVGGWLGRADSERTRFAATGMLSLGIDFDGERL